jgi:hypothetical protein
LEARDPEYLLVVFDLMLETFLGVLRVRVYPLPTDSPGELHVLGHDGDSLGVDGAKVRVFEETD